MKRRSVFTTASTRLGALANSRAGQRYVHSQDHNTLAQKVARHEEACHPVAGTTGGRFDPECAACRELAAQNASSTE